MIRPKPIEAGASAEDEQEGRGKCDQCCQEPTSDSSGRVADYGNGLDYRPRGDLAQRDGIEVLGCGHPVVGAHDVVLHQRDDHEPTTVGECPDFERHPGQRSQAASCCRVASDQRSENSSGARCRRSTFAPDYYLCQAADQQDKHEIGADRGGGRAPEESVDEPPGALA